MYDRYLYRAKTDNGEWVEGYYFKRKIYKDSSAVEHFIMTSKEPKRGRICKAIFFVIDPSTICQCTGAPDKNGKKIYEKNIVRYEDGSVGIVEFGVWDNYSIGFYISWLSGNAKFYRNELGYWAPKVEVIGSAIDNPELLEVGE